MRSVLQILASGLAAVALADKAGSAPCDIYGATGTPCVAAHSVVRALYSNYNGPLYQVQRLDTNATQDIGLLSAGGYVNAPAQDTFCAGADCVILRIYDQSPYGNTLDVGPPGGAVPRPDKPVNATADPIQIGGGHRAYGVFCEGKMGYRRDNTTGVATGNDPETIYMVTAGTHYNYGCCFDYGNAEVDNKDHGPGTMEAVYFGNRSVVGSGAGVGPWVMADLENGLWPGGQRHNPNSASLPMRFVTAMVKGNTNSWAVKGNDATQGSLQLFYDGPRPQGYQPMKKQGAIVLGIGGDNSNGGIGTFYEGVMTQGYSSDAADDAVQASIVAAGYGR